MKLNTNWLLNKQLLLMQRHQNIFQSTSIPSNYLQLSTNKVVFELTDPNLKSSTSTSLHITNPNPYPVQYKIKSTAPFQYIVKPFQGTIEPKQYVRVSIKVILADRNIFKFNLDRFQLLAKPFERNSNPRSKQFWVGAEKHRLSVEIVQIYRQNDYQAHQNGTEEYKTMHSQAINNQNSRTNNIIDVSQKQVLELQADVNQRKESVSVLKKNKLRVGLLNTKNLIIVGVVSFVTGILFS